MIKFTLDHNCIVDLVDRRPNAPHVRALIEGHRGGRSNVAVRRCLGNLHESFVDLAGRMLASGSGAGCGDAGCFSSSADASLAAAGLARGGGPGGGADLPALRRHLPDRARDASGADRAGGHRRLPGRARRRLGRAQPRALDAYAERTFQDAALNVHAAALVLAFLDEVAANGWDYRLDPELGVALALPTAALGPEPARGGRAPLVGARRRADGADAPLRRRRGRRLARRRRRRQRPAGRALHSAPARRPGDGGRARRRPLVLVRSDRVGGHWATVHLAGGPEDAAAINLIAASIRPGPPPPWTLPESGRLAALVAETARLVERALNGKPRPLTAGRRRPRSRPATPSCPPPPAVASMSAPASS